MGYKKTKLNILFLDYQDSDSDREYGRKGRDSPGDNKSSERGRSRSHHRDRYHRERESDSHKDLEYHRISQNDSLWERKPQERKARDRDRCYRDNDRDSVDSERSPDRAFIGASGSEIIGYKSQPPSNTIMIRRLAKHITEKDIRQDIIHCGLIPKDIRLIRKNDTGASRGFAFVEFSTLAEATRWMQMKQGVLVLQNQYRALMQYSIPKELCQNFEKPPSHKAPADWFCIKCGTQNFRRRNKCFKCYASRLESEEGGSGSDEICNYVTKTIMLRNLDVLTMEDSVVQVLNALIPEIAKKISSVCIGKDPLTSISRGICYLGTDSTVDALALYGTLTNLTPPLSIDGKTVIISYCKYNMGDTEKNHEQTINVVFPNLSQSSMYTLNDVDSLAEYSASHYAKTAVEYQQYYEYYKNYFTQQIATGNSITVHQDNQINAAAAVAQSAIQKMHANKTFNDTTHLVVPNGIDGKHYPIPDPTKYTYEKSSGCHYDSTTGLYYYPNSNYYWNSVIQKYLYYDHGNLTYLLAPVSSLECAGVQQPVKTTTESEVKKLKKQDKVKDAKKIAKDMERWAKTLNHKKESSTSRLNSEGSSSSLGLAGSADIGYSVLEKKNGAYGTAHSTLVAGYGKSESSGEETHADEMEFLDFTKLICNLCKRQLMSVEALAKHATLSDLHKKNLEAQKANSKKGEGANGKIVYRDRVKERRREYGNTDAPQSNELKKYLKSGEPAVIPVAASPAEPIGSGNVGNRLLQKMGWTEGQGLGKRNQGRTTIIQAEQHNSTVGLGNKTAYTAAAGESYMSCVKKMTYARYQALTDKP